MKSKLTAEVCDNGEKETSIRTVSDSVRILFYGQAHIHARTHTDMHALTPTKTQTVTNTSKNTSGRSRQTRSCQPTVFTLLIVVWQDSTGLRLEETSFHVGCRMIDRFRLYTDININCPSV